jgi:hypothetical protein
MLASKIICDDTYSNKSWCIVGQEMSVPQEIIITSWSRRCATWSGNTMSIPRHCAIFIIVSNTILLAQAPIHQQFSSAGTVLAPFMHKYGLYAYLCSPCTLAQRCPCHSQPISPPIPLITGSPPDRYPKGLPPFSLDFSRVLCHWFLRRCHPMRSGFVKVVSADASPVEPDLNNQSLLRL